MEQKNRVHGFPHRVVAPEGEGEVADASAYPCLRKVCLDPGNGADKISCVGVVLFDARANTQNIGVKDDVAWEEASLSGQEVVSARADLDASLIGAGLSLFVKGHDYHGSTESTDDAGMTDEFFLSFLEADGINDGLALGAL